MQHPVTVVDYGVGNIGSVLNMFKKISVPVVRAKTADDIKKAERILLPGVGAFDHCMETLNASGLIPALQEAVLKDKKPVLGICVGFQMLFAGSEEGQRPGLGWLAGHVLRFDASKLAPKQKIPHMGWSDIATLPHPLFAGMDEARFYFVHSFHPVPKDGVTTIARCHYGYDFCCGAAKGNIMGVQFHPEKSHRFGMQLFKNFSTMPL